MSDPEYCPICLADLRAAQIPNTTPPQYYSHVLGVEIRGVYDGVLFWECPFCAGHFHRFKSGTDLWKKAQRFVSEVAR